MGMWNQKCRGFLKYITVHLISSHSVKMTCSRIVSPLPFPLRIVTSWMHSFSLWEISPGGIPVFDMPSCIQRLFLTQREMETSGVQWLGTSLLWHGMFCVSFLPLLNFLHQGSASFSLPTLDLEFASFLGPRIYFDSFRPQQRGNLGTARKKIFKGFLHILFIL